MSGGPGTDPALAARPRELCDGVRVLFTGRDGGVSTGRYGSLNLSTGVGDDPAAVAANRDIVLRDLGPGPRTLGWMRQVHGNAVAYLADPPPPAAGAAPQAAAPQADARAAPQADAVYTDSAAIALGALGADCAPVLIADPVAGLAGAAHAGRPGMAAGVLPALIAAMTAAGAQASRMHAVVGPAICGQCYEVPAAMRDEVGALVPGSACVTRAGTPGLDLRAGLRGQLARLGVGSVRDDARCTAESPGLYSYRRDGTTGRFAGLIWLAPRGRSA
ncbi:MAG: peptidoglycan editing factor PgeF [Streptosporangiaceae bacterium]